MWALFFVIVLAAVAVLVSRRKPRAIPREARPTVRIEDIPSVLEALSTEGADGNFAVFLFGADGQPPATRDALNVQFSIEGAQMGIDWVLLAPLNLDTQSRFVTFFRNTGRAVESREMNGVKYLRVEGDGLAELLQEFLRTQFGVTSEQAMGLIADGFDWDTE